MAIPCAQLKIRQSHPPIQEFPLNQDSIKIGRAPDNDLVFREPNISRYHAQIRREPDRYVLTDLDSTDGTWLNNTKLTPQTPYPLAEGDLIGIGRLQLQFGLAPCAPPPSMPTALASTARATDNTLLVTQLDLRGQERLTIGRDRQNDTTIDHPSVSRYHALIQRQQGSLVLKDLNSTNGTFLNGKPIRGDRVLMVGDSIRIGPCRFHLNVDETIVHTNEAGNLRLDALNLNKVVGHGMNLLQDISLSIQPREFVVIAGVSGGGKSTLLDALNGFRPATSGQVLVNGIDLYKNFNAYRTQIGYVPQKDIVHLDLSVEQALDFAAQLRMPADTTKAERKARVHEVLEDLGLTHRRNVTIKSLSGGQLKRVSIGVELITQPSLFFLDEATSGLDPGTEAEMMQLLRNLADRGRTIILITHATENVMLCDRVVFMASGGNLAYFGPPQEALEYFGVEKFNQIYRQVEDELSPQQWQQRYLRSPQYQQYVAQRQKTLETSEGQGRYRPKQPQPGAQVKRISGWRQFLILSRRNLAILTRDRASLILMLAVAPIIGLLDFFAWQPHLFDVKDGDAKLTIVMLFTTALIAVMVGSLAMMREIVKELDIYKRERIIGLQIIPYILSKVWVSLLLALYQAAIFLLFKILAVDIPGSLNVLLSIYIALVLATIAGMVMGLLVSAISPNQNAAPLIAIVFLIPQIIFGGGVLPVDIFGPPGQFINRISLTKWSFESLVTISGLGRDVARDSCWALPEEERENLSDAEKEKCNCLGRSIFQACEFPGIWNVYDPTVDEPEPKKPQDPGNPPPPPEKHQGAIETYQEEIEAYQEKVDEYKKEIDRWQEEYSNWKGKYEGAIGAAEGIIDSFHKDYGNMFDVNVLQHWGILGVSISAMFSLILAAQKRKDIL